MLIAPRIASSACVHGASYCHVGPNRSWSIWIVSAAAPDMAPNSGTTRPSSPIWRKKFDVGSRSRRTAPSPTRSTSRRAPGVAAGGAAAAAGSRASARPTAALPAERCSAITACGESRAGACGAEVGGWSRPGS